ncbi:MAG: ATP-binding protein, partial [Kiritimatiellia bacterium]|nr:ATP-binding protein [Kiritimatiellia bacterium]
VLSLTSELKNMKSGFLDKIIEKLGKLDPQNLQAQFLRLWQEKGLLEAVFNVLRDGIIVLDAHGCIAYVNSTAAAMCGFTVEAASQQPISKYLKDIEWERILNLEEKEWSKLISREIAITYPEKRFLSMYIMPISLDEDKSRGAVVILRDITTEREKERKVLMSERLNALTFLAAGVAHEIGNPLNSLHIHLQLLERELERLPGHNRNNIDKLVKIARGEVERLNMIITQFLKAIRPAVPHRQLWRIEEVLKETIAFMKHEIENRDVIVDVKAPEPIPAISVDRNQIKQAFFNIIKNALQAMTNGGILTITLFSNDRQLGISFKDNGEGMPAEQVGSLFKPYHSDKADGSGLGLFIVQRIVQDHGGEIEVYSQPKSGTTFTIFLPLDERRVRLLKAPRRRRGLQTTSKHGKNE